MSLVPADPGGGLVEAGDVGTPALDFVLQYLEKSVPASAQGSADSHVVGYTIFKDPSR